MPRKTKPTGSTSGGTFHKTEPPKPAITPIRPPLLEQPKLEQPKAAPKPEQPQYVGASTGASTGSVEVPTPKAFPFNKEPVNKEPVNKAPQSVKPTSTVSEPVQHKPAPSTQFRKQQEQAPVRIKGDRPGSIIHDPGYGATDKPTDKPEDPDLDGE